jgi:hypothetical protein
LAIYRSDLKPLKGFHSDERAERVVIEPDAKSGRPHKAFLRYHDPNNWPPRREALKNMSRANLIGNCRHRLIPTVQPFTNGRHQSAHRKSSVPGGLGKKIASSPASGAQVKGRILTLHTGLPPRAGVEGKGR